MMNKVRTIFALLALCICVGKAQSAVITLDLGNTASGLVDGNSYLLAAITAAQSGQSAPFDSGKGLELFGPSFDESWIHTYAAITDPILAATLSFGIFEHDPESPGDQVANFSIGGTDFTAALNALFNTNGDAATSGESSDRYNEYSFDILSLSAILATGSLNVLLELQGPVSQGNDIFGNPQGNALGNSAHLIFSTLTITTQDPTNPPNPPGPTPAPEPGALFLMLVGLLGMRVATKK